MVTSKNNPVEYCSGNFLWPPMWHGRKLFMAICVVISLCPYRCLPRTRDHLHGPVVLTHNYNPSSCPTPFSFIVSAQSSVSICSWPAALHRRCHLSFSFIVIFRTPHLHRPGQALAGYRLLVNQCEMNKNP